MNCFRVCTRISERDVTASDRLDSMISESGERVVEATCDDIDRRIGRSVRHEASNEFQLHASS